MGQIIQILFILAALIMITERATTLILNTYHQLYPAREKKKTEYLASILCLIIGFLITFFSNSNIFELLRIDSLADHKFYIDFTGGFRIEYWIDCLLTGFILCFGSKLFHDLLDLVYETKKRKRKLNEPATEYSNKIEQLKEINDLSSKDYAQMAFDKYKDELLSIPNVSWISLVDDETSQYGKHVIKIYLKDNNTDTVKNLLHLRLPNGIDYPVPTKIITDCGEIKAHYNNFSPGIGIGNRDLYSSGTLGCFLKDNNNQILILTCYHVVQGNLPDYFDCNKYNREVMVVDRTQQNLRIGSLIYGEINEYLDIAIVGEIDPSNCNTIYPCKNLNITRPSIINGSIKGTPVTFRGYTSSCSTGKVYDYGASISDIIFDDGKKRTMHDVIVLQNNGKTMSGKGDSGSVVINDNGEAVGLVFAGDNNNTFAIRMDRIINYLSVYSFA